MLDELSREKISTLIKECERVCDAQLVLVTNKNSVINEPNSLYPALFSSFLISFFLLFLDSVDKVLLFEILIFSSLLLNFLFSKFPKILIFFLPTSLKTRLTYKFAYEKFKLLGYENYRNSVMIFLSIDEKISHIICGEEISTLISNSEFSVILDKFDGRDIVNLVKDVCDLCTQKIPAPKNNIDEIPREIVELK